MASRIRQPTIEFTLRPFMVSFMSSVRR
jgi:hypothetical protein